MPAFYPHAAHHQATIRGPARRSAINCQFGYRTFDQANV